ncbi:hypothetical protein VKT23_007922 [Stygiomarasmius scandens]|uniref:Adhesin domain-containing protein n=1 Tax=Marasmiellus scandens TaxID=2682957 RepID=A0ABR1JP89_9AGAR
MTTSTRGTHESPDSSSPLLQDFDDHTSYSSTPTTRGRPLIPPSVINRKKQNARRAFALATVGVIITAVLIAVRRSGLWKDYDIPPEDQRLARDVRLEKYQSPSDTSLCQDLTSGDRVSFNLSPETDFTFFLSRGSPMAGSIIIQRSDEEFDDIKVEISQAAEGDGRHVESGLSEASSEACHIKNENEQGIMLWAHPGAKSIQRFRTNIVVTLPLGNALRDLSTDFTNGAFMHNIDSIHFHGDVRLNTRNAHILGGTMTASRGFFVQTTNAEIMGDFSSKGTISLQTSNAPIDCSIWPIKSDSPNRALVSVRTNNALIKTSFNLSNNTQVKASIHTSNAALDIFTWPSNKRSIFNLNLDASTSRGHATLHMQPAYEGNFTLRTTKPGEARVKKDMRQLDPLGKGRKRASVGRGDLEHTFISEETYWV